MHLLGIALFVVAGLGWVFGANAIIGPRPGERRLGFEFRPLQRLGDLTSSQKRRLLWLVLACGVLALLSSAMVNGAFGR
jgi:hypothetical protein